MASTHEQALERIQSTVVDGRTENVRFRQGQLQSLHKTLQEEGSSICRALTQDSSSSAVEVQAEFYLALDAIRHFYDTLDFDKELQEEYNVAHGKDNKDRRVAAGLVIVRPTTHTRFYSIVNPLAAAISAGNCVILEVSSPPSYDREEIAQLLLTEKSAPRYPPTARFNPPQPPPKCARPEQLLPQQHPHH